MIAIGLLFVGIVLQQRARRRLYLRWADRNRGTGRRREPPARRLELMCLSHTRAELWETLRLAIAWSQIPTTVADALEPCAPRTFRGGRHGVQAESHGVRRPSGRVAVGSRHRSGAVDVGL